MSSCARYIRVARVSELAADHMLPKVENGERAGEFLFTWDSLACGAPGRPRRRRGPATITQMLHGLAMRPTTDLANGNCRAAAGAATGPGRLTGAAAKDGLAGLALRCPRHGGAWRRQATMLPGRVIHPPDRRGRLGGFWPHCRTDLRPRLQAQPLRPHIRIALNSGEAVPYRVLVRPPAPQGQRPGHRQGPAARSRDHRARGRQAPGRGGLDPLPPSAAGAHRGPGSLSCAPALPDRLTPDPAIGSGSSAKGRWDETEQTWRDGRGRKVPSPAPDVPLRTTKVVLAAAHLDHDPAHCGRRHRNVRALCQRCHMLHDRPEHRRRIRMTLRRRRALGDLFSGPYPS